MPLTRQLTDRVYNIEYHQFADDTQLFVSLDVLDSAQTASCLSDCTTAVRQWFLHNDLQFNLDKSDVVVLGAPQQLQSGAVPASVDVAGSILPVAQKIKSLGVIIDDHLLFDTHVNATISSCTYQTGALRHVRRVAYCSTISPRQSPAAS